jgi:hypothetical protein
VSRLRWLRFRLRACVTRLVRGDGPVRAANPVERAVERRGSCPWQYQRRLGAAS